MSLNIIAHVPSDKDSLTSRCSYTRAEGFQGQERDPEKGGTRAESEETEDIRLNRSHTTALCHGPWTGLYLTRNTIYFGRSNGPTQVLEGNAVSNIYRTTLTVINIPSTNGSHGCATGHRSSIIFHSSYPFHGHEITPRGNYVVVRDFSRAGSFSAAWRCLIPGGASP